MVPHELAEVDVEQHVAAHEQTRIALAQKRGDAPDPTARIEQLALARERERHAGRAVAPRGALEPLREVVGVHDYLVHAVVGEQRELIGDQRDAADGQRGLGQQLGERAQPGAQARGDDHRAHGDSGSSWNNAARSASPSLMNGRQLRIPTATGTSGPSRSRNAPACACVIAVNGERPPIAS